jgi:uncharacterized SAM-binding protein YcdF (DUF218 family)
MSSLLSSPRRRRRLVWVSVLVLAIGAVVVVALATRHSGGNEKPARSSTPAVNPAAERTVPLAAADRRRIDSVVARFVATAVVQRKATSYDLVTSAFRGGTTRAQWATGDTPVYRYPAEPGSAGEPSVVGSFPNDVLVNLLLQPRPGVNAGPILFSVELKRQHSRWLVDGFSPLEVYSAPGAAPKTAVPKLAPAPSKKGTPTPDSGFTHGRLSTAWFLLPVGILLMIVLIPLGLWIKSWRDNRRAERAYGRKKTLPPLPPRR